MLELGGRGAETRPEFGMEAVPLGLRWRGRGLCEQGLVVTIKNGLNSFEGKFVNYYNFLLPLSCIILRLEFQISWFWL